jgi:hypothetical protein
MLREHHCVVSREQRLPNGKVADLLVREVNGDLSIYEVKTELKASLIEAAQNKYAMFCHRLYIAIPHLTLTYLEDQSDVGAWRSGRELVGVVGVYREAMAIFRTAQRIPMKPSSYALANALLPPR